eukprot:380461-Rhodomonas_salina.1
MMQGPSKNEAWLHIVSFVLSCCSVCCTLVKQSQALWDESPNIQGTSRQPAVESFPHFDQLNSSGYLTPILLRRPHERLRTLSAPTSRFHEPNQCSYLFRQCRAALPVDQQQQQQQLVYGTITFTSTDKHRPSYQCDLLRLHPACARGCASAQASSSAAAARAGPACVTLPFACASLWPSCRRPAPLVPSRTALPSRTQPFKPPLRISLRLSERKLASPLVPAA